MNRNASRRSGFGTLVSGLALAALLVSCSESDADPASTGTSGANHSDAASPMGPAAPASGQNSSASDRPAQDPAPNAAAPSPELTTPDSPDAVKPTTPASPSDDAPSPSTTPDGGSGPSSPAASLDASPAATSSAPPGAEPTNDASAPAPAPINDASMGSPAPDVVSCDARAVRCKRLAPTCPEGQVPRIVDTCYGECVDIDSCECDGPDACPEPERFTCINSTQRCSYYLR